MLGLLGGGQAKPRWSEPAVAPRLPGPGGGLWGGRGGGAELGHSWLAPHPNQTPGNREAQVPGRGSWQQNALLWGGSLQGYVW